MNILIVIAKKIKKLELVPLTKYRPAKKIIKIHEISNIHNF